MKFCQITVIFASFLLFSCQSTHDKDVHIFNHSKFLAKNGKNIDMKRVLERLHSQKGPVKEVVFADKLLSSHSWLDKDGNFVRRYSLTQKETKFYEFLPILSYFLPKTYKNYEIVINFDKNNQVLGVESFYDEIRLKGRIFCRKGAGGCVSGLN